MQCRQFVQAMNVMLQLFQKLAVVEQPKRGRKQINLLDFKITAQLFQIRYFAGFHGEGIGRCPQN